MSDTPRRGRSQGAHTYHNVALPIVRRGRARVRASSAHALPPQSPIIMAAAPAASVVPPLGNAAGAPAAAVGGAPIDNSSQPPAPDAAPGALNINPPPPVLPVGGIAPPPDVVVRIEAARRAAEQAVLLDYYSSSVPGVKELKEERDRLILLIRGRDHLVDQQEASINDQKAKVQEAKKALIDFQSQLVDQLCNIIDIEVPQGKYPDIIQHAIIQLSELAGIQLDEDTRRDTSAAHRRPRSRSPSRAHSRADHRSPRGRHHSTSGRNHSPERDDRHANPRRNSPERRQVSTPAGTPSRNNESSLSTPAGGTTAHQHFQRDNNDGKYDGRHRSPPPSSASSSSAVPIGSFPPPPHLRESDVQLRNANDFQRMRESSVAIDKYPYISVPDRLQLEVYKRELEDPHAHSDDTRNDMKRKAKFICDDSNRRRIASIVKLYNESYTLGQAQEYVKQKHGFTHQAITVSCIGTAIRDATVTMHDLDRLLDTGLTTVAPPSSRDYPSPPTRPSPYKVNFGIVHRLSDRRLQELDELMKKSKRDRKLSAIDRTVLCELLGREYHPTARGNSTTPYACAVSTLMQTPGIGNRPDDVYGYLKSRYLLDIRQHPDEATPPPRAAHYDHEGEHEDDHDIQDDSPASSPDPDYDYSDPMLVKDSQTIDDDVDCHGIPASESSTWGKTRSPPVAAAKTTLLASPLATLDAPGGSTRRVYKPYLPSAATREELLAEDQRREIYSTRRSPVVVKRNEQAGRARSRTRQRSPRLRSQHTSVDARNYNHGSRDQTDDRNRSRSRSTRRTRNISRRRLVTPEPESRITYDRSRSPKRVRVLMMSIGGAKHTSITARDPSGAQFSMPSFVPRSTVGVREYLDHYFEWIRTCRRPEDTWVDTLISLIPDSTVRTDLRRIERKAGESLRSHYNRVEKKFKSVYELSANEMRSYRQIYHNIAKVIDEHIDDYIDRFVRMHDQAFPGESLHTQRCFDTFIHGLDADFQRYSVQLVFVDESETPEDIRDRREINAGGVLVTQWTQLAGIARAYYLNRNPRDVEDSMVKAALDHKARAAAGVHTLAPILSTIGQQYTGRFARSVEERSMQVGSAAASYANPPVRHETLKVLETHIKHLHPSATEIAAAATKRMQQQQRNGQQQPQSRSDVRRLRAIAKKDAKNADQPAKKKYKTDKHDSRNRPAATSSGSTSDDGDARMEYADRHCPDCCMNHVWDDCVRNENSAKHIPHMLSKRGTPHPNATDDQIAATKEMYGRVGVPQGQNPPRIRTVTSSKSEQVTTFAIRMGRSGSRDIVLTGQIGKVKKLSIFVDTGSQISLISRVCYEAFRSQFGPLLPAPSYELYVADGRESSNKILGSLKLATTFDDPNHKLRFTREVEFVVMDGLAEPVIAGLDLLTKFFTNIGIQDGRLTFRADLAADIDAANPQKIDTESAIRITNTTHLRGRTTRMVRVEFDASLNKHADCPVLCQPHTVYNKHGHPFHIEFPPTIQNHQGGTTASLGRNCLMIMNHSSQDIVLNRNQIIGKAHVIVTNTEVPPTLFKYYAESRIRTSKDPISTQAHNVHRIRKEVARVLMITKKPVDLSVLPDNELFIIDKAASTIESAVEFVRPFANSASSSSSSSSSSATASGAPLRM